MPNWDNYLYDLAFVLNWAIYVGGLFLSCVALASIVIFIVYVGVMKTKEIHFERQFKKLDKKSRYVDGHSLEL